MCAITKRRSFFRAIESNGFDSDVPMNPMKNNKGLNGTLNGTSKSFRYMRRQPTIVQYDQDDLHFAARGGADNNNGAGSARGSMGSPAMTRGRTVGGTPGEADMEIMVEGTNILNV
jgi:hypothetical protein